MSLLQYLLFRHSMWFRQSQKSLMRETSLKVPFTEKLLKELGIVLSEQASTALINPDIKQQKNVTKTTDLPDKKDKTAKKTVMLDAGHGYKFDSGAVSKKNRQSGSFLLLLITL